MTYIATPKLITILGVDFKSYLTEEGEVVFSQRSTAQGFGFKDGNNIERIVNRLKAETLTSTEVHTLRATKAETRIPSSGQKAETLTSTEVHTLRVQGTGQPIKVITKPELIQLVDILAAKGNEVAQSMLTAGAATIIQMAVDEAYGVERDRGDYISASNKIAAEMRSQLRAMSGRVTNPLLHCNVYAENNLLVYGDGYTRDNYDKEDAYVKHHESELLESIQAGLKMAGLPLAEVIKLSHDMFRLKFRNQTRTQIEG